MKKKYITTLCLLGLATTLCACSSEEPFVTFDYQVVNDISEVEKNEFVNSVKADMAVPEEAQDVKYYVCEIDGIEEKLGEIQYTLDDKEILQYVTKTDQTTLDDETLIQEYTDYSYMWFETENATVSNYDALVLTSDDAKAVIWLDTKAGVGYGIVAEDETLTTDDLLQIANEIA